MSPFPIPIWSWLSQAPSVEASDRRAVARVDSPGPSICIEQSSADVPFNELGGYGYPETAYSHNHLAPANHHSASSDSSRSPSPSLEAPPSPYADCGSGYNCGYYRNSDLYGSSTSLPTSNGGIDDVVLANMLYSTRLSPRPADPQYFGHFEGSTSNDNAMSPALLSPTTPWDGQPPAFGHSPYSNTSSPYSSPSISPSQFCTPLPYHFVPDSDIFPPSATLCHVSPYPSAHTFPGAPVFTTPYEAPYVYGQDEEHSNQQPQYNPFLPLGPHAFQDLSPHSSIFINDNHHVSQPCDRQITPQNDRPYSTSPVPLVEQAPVTSVEGERRPRFSNQIFDPLIATDPNYVPYQRQGKIPFEIEDQVRDAIRAELLPEIEDPRLQALLNTKFKVQISTLAGEEASKARRKTGTRCFFCRICGDDVTTKYNLQCHIRSHFTQRDEGCMNCERTFVTRSVSVRHQKKCHQKKCHQKKCPKSSSASGPAIR
ncbi:hypothetical protein B0H34DRAFT_162433 [Crassisporium funariophilum]|nr:hypothetical protein B0H34DRAFT_162433 [Crassisporium funariophilum]